MTIHWLRYAVLTYLLCWSLPIQAAVIDQQEWESMPGSPWSYTGGGVPNTDCSMPPSPSGGCALKFTYAAGTYSTSFSGGRAERAMNGETDVYLGHWSRYSSPFTINFNGTKQDLMGLSGQGFPSNFITTWNGQGPFGGGSADGVNQIIWGGGTQNHFCNITNFDLVSHLAQWFWVEFHIKLNTPGQSDGIFDLWYDDVPCAHYTNIEINDASQTLGLALIQHTAEWGGGGGTIPTTGYWWVDHTVLSTTRIGRPAGGSIDPIPGPPAIPTGLTVSELIKTWIEYLFAWLGPSDALAVTNQSATVTWTPTADPTILYDLDMTSFANGWQWTSVTTGLKSTLGQYAMTFGPYADSTGDRGLCVRMRAYYAASPTNISAWTDNSCIQVPLAATPTPTPIPMPIPTPPPPPPPPPANVQLTQLQANVIAAQASADKANGTLAAIKQAICAVMVNTSLRNALRTAMGGCP